MVPQFPLTRDATRAFNLSCIEQEGLEADDIIATLAVQAREAGGRVTIISSDKDLMQLVGGGVSMLDAMKNKHIDPDGVFEKFGVKPDKVIDVQALAGDSVDNVPGAPGIGIKTAALLINEYGDLDSLLARADEIKQPKRRETLIEFADQIRVSRELVTLKTDAVLDVAIEDFEVKDPVPDEILAFLTEMEFRTLTTRIASKLGVEPPEMPKAATGSIAGTSQTDNGEPLAATSVPIDPEKYECIRTMAELGPWIDAIYDKGYVAVDTETTGLNEMVVDLVGVCLSVEPGKACYIPLIHKQGSDDLFGSDTLADGQINIDEALSALKPMLEDPAILKIGQNMKYDTKNLDQDMALMLPHRRHDVDVLRLARGFTQSRYGCAFGSVSRPPPNLDQNPIRLRKIRDNL